MHFHNISWNLSTGTRKSFGCLLDDTKQSRVTLAPRPASSQPSDCKHRTEEGVSTVSAKSSLDLPSRTRDFWEIMTSRDFKALRFGAFCFTTILTETVSTYKILNPALGKYLRKMRPLGYRNSISPSHITILQ